LTITLRRDNTMKKWTIMNNISTLFLLGIVTVLVSGCGIPGAIKKATTSIDEATRILDNGIADIGVDSSKWREVLQGVAKDLPKEIQSTIKTEAQNLATRSIAATGEEFRCDAKFLGDRAKQALQRLKEMLGGSRQAPLPPTICHVVPSEIDLKLQPDRWDKITISGYDFDHEDSQGNELGFALLGGGDSDVLKIKKESIGETTFFKRTLNLRDYKNIMYEKKITKVVPLWQGTIAGIHSGEVVVQQWEPATREDIVTPSRTTWSPPLVHGDGDFDTGGNDPMSVKVEAKLWISNTTIKSKVWMWARESKGDNTTVRGWSKWASQYTSPGGWKIVDVTPSASAIDSEFNITDHGVYTRNRPSGEVLSRFTIWGDKRGHEAGGYTRVQADWRELRVNIQEVKPSWYDGP
jgi:hypothetical protein